MVQDLWGGGETGVGLSPLLVSLLPSRNSVRKAHAKFSYFSFPPYFLPSEHAEASPSWLPFSPSSWHIPPPAPSLLPCPPLIYKIKSPDSILHYSQMFNTFQVIAPPPKKKKQKQKQKNKHDFFSDLTTQPVYIYVREILRHCFNNRTHLLVWLLRCPSWT